MPTGADHRPAGSGSIPRTAPSPPGPGPPAVPAPGPRAGTHGSSYGHAPGAGRSPRSTSPAGAARAPPHRPPTRASGPPGIAAMMITATIPEKPPQAAQTRRSTDTRHGEVDLAGPGNFS